MRKRYFKTLIIAAVMLFLACDNSLDIVATTPYTEVSSSSVGGSFGVGDALEPGGNDPSLITGIWMMTHKDQDGDDAIDLVTETTNLHSKVYQFTNDYGWYFYSSPDGTQESLGLGAEAVYYYSAEEGIIYKITTSTGLVNQLFTDITIVNEVVDGVAQGVMYMTIPASGGTYIRLERKTADYLPEV